MGGALVGTGAAYWLALSIAAANAASSRSQPSPMGNGVPAICMLTTMPTRTTWASTSSGPGTRSQRSTAPETATTIATVTSGPM